MSYPDICWDNIVLSSNLILHIEYNIDFSKYLYEFFIYSSTNPKDIVIRTIKDLVKQFGNGIIVEKSDRVEYISNIVCVIYTHVYGGIDDILLSRKIDCTAACYNGSLHTTKRFISSVNNMKNKVTYDINLDDIESLIYYRNNGFRIVTKDEQNTIVNFDLCSNPHYINLIKKESDIYIDILDNLISLYRNMKTTNRTSGLLNSNNRKIFYYRDDFDLNKMVDFNRMYMSSLIDNVKIEDNPMCNLPLNELVTASDNDILNIIYDNVDKVSDSNKFDIIGRSLAYISILSKSSKCSLYLFDEELQPCIFTKTSLMHIAVENNMVDIFNFINEDNLLKTDEWDLNCVVYAILFNRIELFKEILETMKDVLNLSCLLEISIMVHRNEIARILFDEVDIDAFMVSDIPVNVAIKFKNFDIFKFLIRNKAKLPSGGKGPLSILLSKLCKEYDSVLDKILQEFPLEKTEHFPIEVINIEDKRTADSILIKEDIVKRNNGKITLMQMIDNRIYDMSASRANKFLVDEVGENTKNLDTLIYLRKIFTISSGNKYIPIESTRYNFDIRYISIDNKVPDQDMYVNMFNAVYEKDNQEFANYLQHCTGPVYSTRSGRNLVHVCIKNDNVEAMNVLINNTRDEHLHYYFTRINPIEYAIEENATRCLYYMLSNARLVQFVRKCISHKITKKAFLTDNVDIVDIIVQKICTGINTKIDPNVYHFKEVSYDNIVRDCVKSCKIKSFFYSVTKLKEYIQHDILSPSFVDGEGMNYMHHLCSSNIDDNKIYDFIHSLHKFDQDLINGKDKHGRTPLFYASTNKDPVIVHILIQLGSLVDTIDNDGCNVLHHMITYDRYENKDKINTLTRYIEVLNDKTVNEKQTPLILAAKYKKEVYLQALLEHFANERSVDILGNTYTHYAMYNGLDIVMKLQNHGFENNFGLTPLECLALRVKMELSNGSLHLVHKFLELYDMHSRQTVPRTFAKVENVIKMKHNIAKLVGNNKNLNKILK